MWTDATIAALVRGFEDCTLPKAQWTHTAHQIVALHHVRRFGRAEGGRRMRSGIQRFNAANGGNPSAYHETVTLAWIAIVARFLDNEPTDGSLQSAVESFIAECGGTDYLLRFYSRERLMSEEARTGWLPPDRTPIEVD